MNVFVKSFTSFGAAVIVHGAVVWGVVGLGPQDRLVPTPLSGFEIVELPSSAAAEQLKTVEDTVEKVIEEPVAKAEPEPVVMAKAEPSLKSKTIQKPKPVQKPNPKAKSKPKPKPKSKPLPKPEANIAPFKGADAVAAQPAYVPPSQHVAYLKNPKPAYPTQARKRGMEGRVILRVQVRFDGAVKSVELQQSSGYGLLDRAARVAVLRWRFAPATRGGRVVDGEVLIPFDFRLTSG